MLILFGYCAKLKKVVWETQLWKINIDNINKYGYKIKALSLACIEKDLTKNTKITPKKYYT